jgi:hypothetical protein
MNRSLDAVEALYRAEVAPVALGPGNGRLGHAH